MRERRRAEVVCVADGRSGDVTLAGVKWRATGDGEGEMGDVGGRRIEYV